MLWKSICDIIFHNARINFPIVVCKALAHVQEHVECNSGLLGRKLILNNFSSSDDFILFSHANVNQANKIRFVGFFISNSNYVINVAGCCAQAMDDSSLDDLFALGIALQTTSDQRLGIKHIFFHSPTMLATITNPDPVVTWRFNSQIANIRYLLNEHDSHAIHCILRHWLLSAVHLATHGFNFSALNLFLFG